MLYLAKFEELTHVVVDAPDPETATAMVEAAVGERPETLHEIPAGLFMAELRFATPDDEEPEEDNPANVTSTGVALDPFDPLAEWLDEVESADVPELSLLPTLVDEPATG